MTTPGLGESGFTPEVEIPSLGRMTIPPELGFSLPRRRRCWLLIVPVGNQKKNPSVLCFFPHPMSSLGNPSLPFSAPDLFVFPSRLTAWPQTALCLLLKLGHVKTSCHGVLSPHLSLTTHTRARAHTHTHTRTHTI